MSSHGFGRPLEVGPAETLLRQHPGQGAEVVLCEMLPRGLCVAEAAQHHFLAVTGSGKRVGGDEIMVVDRMTRAVRLAGCHGE